MTKPKTVCVVGAGPSGLVAAKALLYSVAKGTIAVSMMDSQDAVGGLWPSSASDGRRQAHPLMLANQSRHTMHFSDLTWDAGAPHLPRAWQVGRYLERYLARYLTGHPAFHLRLGTRVVRTEPRDGVWELLLDAGGQQMTERFEHLLVASGYFRKPHIPPRLLVDRPLVPVVHSSQYCDLRSLLGEQRIAKGGSILVVGGQMSGVEVAGTIAANLSSAVHSPGDAEIDDAESYTVHHLVQRPTWIFPVLTTSEPGAVAGSFLPLDFASYNLNARALPLDNTQGHVTPEAAQAAHALFETALGSDQSAFSPSLCVDAAAQAEPPYLAVSDWYCDFVRSGAITTSRGRLESLQGTTALLSPPEAPIPDVAAVVLATGFDPSSSLSFLGRDTLRTLHHAPQHPAQPLVLAFHGTHHPDVPRLGFVGFYRSPYWGVMQMQARFLAQLWARPDCPPQPLLRKLASDDSIARTLALREDPRTSQYPMGDYIWLMHDFADALSIPPCPPRLQQQLSLDMVTPYRFAPPSDPQPAGDEAAALTTPSFVAGAVFRSLLGAWKLERRLTSRLPSHPSGHFRGTARFLLRAATPDGHFFEYLYVEDGDFTTDAGIGFRASRHYIWRYDERRDVLSTWFTKPDDPKRADYLFHEIQFLQPPEGGRAQPWQAKAGHLCIDDFYDVKYAFAFHAVNLCQWDIQYSVNGPKKDYTISGTYTR